jgi:hypothetical protein
MKSLPESMSLPTLDGGVCNTIVVGEERILTKYLAFLLNESIVIESEEQLAKKAKLLDRSIDDLKIVMSAP